MTAPPPVPNRPTPSTEAMPGDSNLHTPAAHGRYLPSQVVVLGSDGGSAHVSRNAHGQLVLHTDTTSAPVVVQPVPAFALTAPREHLSLVDAQGRERGTIAHLDALPSASREAVEAALALREFIPVITAITAVRSFSTPTVWNVDTDRGPTQLQLQSEDDIRKLDPEGRTLRITDKNSLQYQILDTEALSKASRKLLARFI